VFGSSGATLCDSRGAAVEPEAESGTDAYVFGSSSVVQWPNGQAITMARPTTSSSETVPKSVRWCARESAEFDRWSPITHSRPSGTVTSNGVVDGLSPGYR
jgi:hypothetical protein